MFSSQQSEQILKLFPANFLQSLKNVEPVDEFDMSFYGMVTYNLASNNSNTWIVDPGASDHITCFVDLLSNARLASGNHTIKLSTGVV